MAPTQAPELVLSARAHRQIVRSRFCWFDGSTENSEFHDTQGCNPITRPAGNGKTYESAGSGQNLLEFDVLCDVIAGLIQDGGEGDTIAGGFDLILMSNWTGVRRFCGRE